MGVLSPSRSIRLPGAFSPRGRRRAAGESFERRVQAGVSGDERGNRPGEAVEGRGGVAMMPSQP